jgi:hypothetical protein
MARESHRNRTLFVPFLLFPHLEEGEEVVRGHGAAREEVARHPVGLVLVLKVVGGVRVREDVHEQQAAGAEPPADALQERAVLWTSMCNGKTKGKGLCYQSFCVVPTDPLRRSFSLQDFRNACRFIASRSSCARTSRWRCSGRRSPRWAPGSRSCCASGPSGSSACGAAPACRCTPVLKVMEE